MSLKNHLFQSETDPIPPVRPDIEIIPIPDNGNSYLYFHDQLGYVPSNFALDSRTAPLLSLLDGRKSIRDLEPWLDTEVTKRDLLEYVQFLDEHRLLYSAHFKAFAEKVEQEYESASVHRSTTAGSSYPADPEELKQFLDEALGETKPEKRTGLQHPKALYAPHIDPKVALSCYVKAFSPIRHITPRRVVILATSHYAGMYPGRYDNRPFIATTKDFEMPLATIKTDVPTVEKLAEESREMGISLQDRAHRIEHSIELHLLFLSYLWNHDFTVVPVLVDGFDDLFYMKDAHLADQIERLGEYLRETCGDEETFFLISGDLSHIGRKFGDLQPAGEMLDSVKEFDRQFLQYAEKGNPENLLDLVSEGYNPYRVCGFPPLYTFLKSFSGIKGEVLEYDVWDETERESAVTFGSILFR